MKVHSSLLSSENWILKKGNRLRLEDTDKGLFIKSDIVGNESEYITFKSGQMNAGGFDECLKEGFLAVDFNGDASSNISAELLVVGYDLNHEVVKAEATELNSVKVFKLNGSIKTIDILMKISGDGTICLSNIEILFRTEIGNTLKHFRTINTSESYLLLTNIYPTSRDLYRNGFVHRRVKNYLDRGLNVDVFCLNRSFRDLFDYSFDGVNVYLGDMSMLSDFLKTSNYKKILIHFVNKDMMDVLDEAVPDMPVIVWVHGFETEKWNRRLFNYKKNISTLLEMSNIIERSKKRTEFMHNIYTNSDRKRNIEFVFVSKWFKEEIAEKDTNCKVINSHIIPNVIDENLFNYRKKTPEQRKKILSIRSYAYHKYANDLTVKAILELSKETFFEQLEFDLYGEGVLFEDTVKPLRRFDNVKLYNTYLRQEEIASLHKEHGIFICPTRLDSQGVSMCEAMSSGLVPVASGITAIPEFVKLDSGILGRKENYKDLANGIKELFFNEDKFLSMSENAARSIQMLCSTDKTISKEIEIIKK